MQVFAGCYINSDDPTNTPRMHICNSEQELVDKLMADIGEAVQGLQPQSLEELSDFVGDYCENPYSSITWEVKEL